LIFAATGMAASPMREQAAMQQPSDSIASNP
jgi:hypothetical protein